MTFENHNRYIEYKIDDTSEHVQLCTPRTSSCWTKNTRVSPVGEAGSN